MNNITNYNYLYDIDGKTIAVKANSKEGQQINDDAVSVTYNGEEWLTFDASVDLSQGKTVDTLNVNQIVSLFSDGNLTIDELNIWIENNNAELTRCLLDKDGNRAEITFQYNNTKYELSCSWENAEFQTDNKVVAGTDKRNQNNPAATSGATATTSQTTQKTIGQGYTIDELRNALHLEGPDAPGESYVISSTRPQVYANDFLDMLFVKNGDKYYLKDNFTFDGKTYQTLDDVKNLIENSHARCRYSNGRYYDGAPDVTVSASQIKNCGYNFLPEELEAYFDKNADGSYTLKKPAVVDKSQGFEYDAQDGYAFYSFEDFVSYLNGNPTGARWMSYWESEGEEGHYSPTYGGGYFQIRTPKGVAGNLVTENDVKRLENNFKKNDLYSGTDFSKYFTKTQHGEYVVNQSAVKATFPDKEIKTLQELWNAFDELSEKIPNHNTNGGDLSQGKTVDTLNVNQIVSLFSDGNLTIDELNIWIESNNAELIKCLQDKTGNKVEVTFKYNGTTYKLACTWEKVQFQTDENVESNYDNSNRTLPVPYDKEQYEDLKKGSTAGWALFKNDWNSNRWTDDSPYENKWFPSDSQQKMTTDDFTQMQLVELSIRLHDMNKGKRTIPQPYVYDGYTPKFVSGELNPPYLRVGIDNNNYVSVINDTIKCVQKYLNVVEDDSKDEFCTRFGINKGDSDDVIRQKMNNYYSKMDGAVKDSNGNYKVPLESYYKFLSDSDLDYHDVDFYGYISAMPITISSAANTEETVNRWNMTIDIQNQVVDYGFVIDDVYEYVQSWNYGNPSYDAKENDCPVVSVSELMDNLQNGFPTESDEWRLATNPELVAALKRAEADFGGADNLIKAWFGDRDNISPEELLARLTGTHPDGGKSYVKQNSYSREMIEEMSTFGGQNFKIEDYFTENPDGTLSLKPGLTADVAFRGSVSVNSLGDLPGGHTFLNSSVYWSKYSPYKDEWNADAATNDTVSGNKPVVVSQAPSPSLIPEESKKVTDLSNCHTDKTNSLYYNYNYDYDNIGSANFEWKAKVTWAAVIYNEILTDEQRAYVDSELAKGAKPVAPVLVSLTNEQIQMVSDREDIGWYILDSKKDPNGKYELYELGYADCELKLRANHETHNPDDLYYRDINMFVDEIKNNSTKRKEFGDEDFYFEQARAKHNVQIDGDNIRFTEDSVADIKKLLNVMNSEKAPMRRNENGFGTDVPYNYLAMLGLELGKEYTDEEIWAKISEFCKTVDPSSDGKTLSIEDYYNACVVSEVGIFGNTYNQIVADYNAETKQYQKEYSEFLAQHPGFCGYENIYQDENENIFDFARRRTAALYGETPSTPSSTTPSSTPASTTPSTTSSSPKADPDTDAPSVPSDEEEMSDVIMSNEEYKAEVDKQAAILQQKTQNIIKEGNIYYTIYNNVRYNYVWSPFDNKWLTYEDSQLKNGRVQDSTDEKLIRIMMILAALMQGLSFTADPRICRDDDGNYYYFDEKSNSFVKS